jgi:2-isopropylmalate synthase
LDKLQLAKKLDSLGFDFLEGGFPGSNEKDAEFFQKIAEKPLDQAVVCAFGMTRRKGVKPEDDEGLRSLLDSQAPIITIVGKASAFQVVEVINAKLEENLQMVAETVDFFRKHGRRVFFDAEHFFDGWKADSQYSLSVLKTAVSAGAEIVILCDTNGGSMPELIRDGVKSVAGVVNVPVGIHAHNDCGVAVANSLIAVDAGATQVQGTINGIGERCGNANLIAIAANLALKKQGAYSVLKPDSLQYLTELSRFVYETVNFQIPLHDPFVGRSAFAHKGGMHVSGVARNSAAYEHIAPELVGNARRVLISELSGRSNIAAKTKDLNLDAETIQRILAEVVKKENQGYQYEAAEGSFDLIVKKCTGTFKEHFKRLNYHVYVESNERGVLVTVATVKLQIGDQIRHEVAEGDGPVAALDAALRKALLSVYPSLSEMRLIDFKVRVINSEAATDAAVRVVIESEDKEGNVWGTIGADENVIEASWLALVDSIEYKLNRT